MNELLARNAHTAQPWLIHDVAADFELYDVWALPTPGGPEDFPLLLAQFLEGNLAKKRPWSVRALFAIRWRVGGWLGWDAPTASLGTRVPSMRERLPAALSGDSTPDPRHSPFTSIYATDAEWAAEIANRTVHAIMHVGWVKDGDFPGRYRGQMAVLVKPNGRLGRVYMAAIAPFRHSLVYPALMRGIASEWRDRTAPKVDSEYTWSDDLGNAIPETAHARANYADALTLNAGSDLPARWWASTMFEQLIRPAKREALFRVVLALRPARESPTLMDWHVVEESGQLLRLERDGFLMCAHITVRSTQETVRLDLTVGPRNRLGAAIWRKVAPEHRRAGRSLLRRAWQLSQRGGELTPPRLIELLCVGGPVSRRGH